MLGSVLVSALAVVAGYAAMAVLVMVAFVGGPLLLGVDRVLSPETYDATPLWQVLAMVISLSAAVAGGAVCRLLARRRGAGVVLALAVALLGAVVGIRQPPRPAVVPTREPNLPLPQLFENAKTYAREPLLTRISNPLLAGAGVLLGNAWVAPRRRARHAASAGAATDR